MALKKWSLFVLVLSLFAICPKTVLADHDSEKRKINDKYDIVSFGPSERLTDNLMRVGKAIAGGGTSEGSLEVYRKRYRELKSHWDDAEAKFKEKNVDVKNEPVYFGVIDWVQKSEIPVPSLPGVPKPPKIVTDHFIQFYVAARKKGENDLPDNARYALQAPKSKFNGWYLDIVGREKVSTDGKYTVLRSLGLTKEDGPQWRAIKGKNGVKLSLQAPGSKFNGWYLDIVGRDKPSTEGRYTVVRNLGLNKEEGPEWMIATKGKNGGVKLTLQAPKTDYQGWYLDMDDKAEASKKGQSTFAQNLMLTKENGPEWVAIAK